MNFNSTLFILNAVLNIPLSAIAIVGNALVLISVIRTPSLLSSSNMLLLSIALIDLGVGLVAQPFYITLQFLQFTGAHDNITTASKVQLYCSSVLCLVSFAYVTLLSVDRFLALHFHLRYKKLVTVKRTVSLLAVVWFASVGVSTLLPRDFQLIGATILFTCLFVNIVLYYKLYLIVRLHQRQINSLARGRFDTGGRNVTRLKRSFIDMFFVCLLFLACYFPYTVISNFRSKLLPFVMQLSWTVNYFNSCLSPLLISRRFPEIRAAVNNTVKKAK